MAGVSLMCHWKSTLPDFEQPVIPHALLMTVRITLRGSGISKATMNKIARVNCIFWIMKICATIWTVILTTSTAGTTMSDFMYRSLGLGYAKGSLILTICLITVLATWYFSEKSLSLGSIRTGKAEVFEPSTVPGASRRK